MGPQAAAPEEPLSDDDRIKWALTYLNFHLRVPASLTASSAGSTISKDRAGTVLLISQSQAETVMKALNDALYSAPTSTPLVMIYDKLRHLCAAVEMDLLQHQFITHVKPRLGGDSVTRVEYTRHQSLTIFYWPEAIGLPVDGHVRDKRSGGVAVASDSAPWPQGAAQLLTDATSSHAIDTLAVQEEMLASGPAVTDRDRIFVRFYVDSGNGSCRIRMLHNPPLGLSDTDFDNGRADSLGAPAEALDRRKLQQEHARDLRFPISPTCIDLPSVVDRLLFAHANHRIAGLYAFLKQVGERDSNVFASIQLLNQHSDSAGGASHRKAVPVQFVRLVLLDAIGIDIKVDMQAGHFALAWSGGRRATASSGRFAVSSDDGTSAGTGLPALRKVEKQLARPGGLDLFVSALPQLRNRVLLVILAERLSILGLQAVAKAPILFAHQVQTTQGATDMIGVSDLDSQSPFLQPSSDPRHSARPVSTVSTDRDTWLRSGSVSMAAPGNVGAGAAVTRDYSWPFARTCLFLSLASLGYGRSYLVIDLNDDGNPCFHLVQCAVLTARASSTSAAPSAATPASAALRPAQRPNSAFVASPRAHGAASLTPSRALGSNGRLVTPSAQGSGSTSNAGASAAELSRSVAGSDRGDHVMLTAKTIVRNVFQCGKPQFEIKLVPDAPVAPVSKAAASNGNAMVTLNSPSSYQIKASARETALHAARHRMTEYRAMAAVIRDQAGALLSDRSQSGLPSTAAGRGSTVSGARLSPTYLANVIRYCCTSLPVICLFIVHCSMFLR